MRRLVWKAIFNKQPMDLTSQASTYFSQQGIKKADYRAIRDLVEFLHENGGLEGNVEFDYETGNLWRLFTHFPCIKKSTKFPPLQN